MTRRMSEPLTEREAQIMDVVWRLGEATADQVRAEVPGSPHDSTVRTLLRVLETKGYLSHEATGKAYVYRATVARRRRSGWRCEACWRGSSPVLRRTWCCG